MGRVAAALALLLTLGTPGAADARQYRVSSHTSTSHYASSYHTFHRAPAFHHASYHAHTSRSYTPHHTTHAAHANGTRIHRSPAARSAFQHSHPCPSTGRRSGACPGYVVDHVTALKRGGADSPSNMQWQTREAAKAKDKWE